jgi:TRAP-type transport system periplasmic protein
MKKKMVWVVCVVTILFFTSSFSYGAEAIKLKFANYFPPTHKHSVIMDEYCKALNQELAGKAEVTYYPGGTLLNAPKMAAGVASKIADIGMAHVGYSRGRFPVMEIMGLPLGFPSGWIGNHVANDFYEKFKPKEWGEYYPLMFSTSTPTIIQTISKPVKTMEDLKGLKIRGTGRVADIIKALGATPMPIEMMDLYESLRRSVIDGNLGPMEQLQGWKTGEVLKYITTSWKVGSTDTFYVAMNKSSWTSLPEEVKKVLTAVTKTYREKWAVLWNNIDIDAAGFLKTQGGQILPLADEEAARWVKAAEPVVVAFKQDLVSKGYKAEEIDGWITYIKERIEYWKGQEKAAKIATIYQY